MCNVCIRGNLAVAKASLNLQFTYIELRSLIDNVCSWGQVHVLEWMHDVIR
jgi:hypothetical protein